MVGHSDCPIIPRNVARLPFLLECEPILPHLASPAHPGSLEITSKTLEAVMCDAEDLCSVNTAHEPVSSFTTSPRNTTRPLSFWNFLSNSELLR